MDADLDDAQGGGGAVPLDGCSACSQGEPTTTPIVGRLGKASSWIVPGLTLALMPKCPACLAGYILAASGLGLSVAVAATLRSVVLAGCIGLLSLLIARRALRWMRAA